MSQPPFAPIAKLSMSALVGSVVCLRSGPLRWTEEIIAGANNVKRRAGGSSNSDCGSCFALEALRFCISSLGFLFWDLLLVESQFV